ncbi:MAG: glycosyltransferase family 4 protein [archaeon]
MIYCTMFSSLTLPTGAHHYYSGVSRLLSGFGTGIAFSKILGMRPQRQDTVLANIGPFGFIYHYLRQRHNLHFRIVRDVQAPLLSSYLFCENICSTLMEDYDAVLFPSEYARQLYIRLFPRLNCNNTFVCYPILHRFPEQQTRHRTRRKTIGCIGRLSEDKNIDQLLEAFFGMNDFDLVLCGHQVQPYLKENIVRMMRNRGLEESRIEFTETSSIWEILDRIDILAFPSTSSVESLGRVIMEASHMGIPVVAANHAASPELLPGSNLLHVAYNNGPVSLENPKPLGTVSVEELRDKLKTSQAIGSNDYYHDHDAKLKCILDGSCRPDEARDLDREVVRFIEAARVRLNDYRIPAREAVKAAVAHLSAGNYADFAKTGYEIAEGLNYRPYLTLALDLPGDLEQNRSR